MRLACLSKLCHTGRRFAHGGLLIHASLTRDQHVSLGQGLIDADGREDEVDAGGQPAVQEDVEGKAETACGTGTWHVLACRAAGFFGQRSKVMDVAIHARDNRFRRALLGAEDARASRRPAERIRDVAGNLEGAVCETSVGSCAIDCRDGGKTSAQDACRASICLLEAEPERREHAEAAVIRRTAADADDEAAAAVIEGSKVFSKHLMKKYGIPTAAYETFDDMDAALAYLDTAPVPVVVKADGLALGKGVIIAQSREEAKEAVVSMMRDGRFGESGRHIVIEEFLTGPEVSVLSLTGGEALVPMVSSMDHKRALDGDEGLNTGGMGTIAPNPFYTDEIAAECMEKIFLPTIRAMRAEGRTFRGCLYFGLMLTLDGPKVIEYNCRFGDPETQVVLPLLESDLLTVMQATTNGTLKDTPVRFKTGSACCCVVMASQGYPQSYKTGFPITMDTDAAAHTFVAGAKLREDGVLVTSGGRVAGVTAVQPTLEQAVQAAYERVGHVHFENAYYRRDIGARALQALREEK